MLKIHSMLKCVATRQKKRKTTCLRRSEFIQVPFNGILHCLLFDMCSNVDGSNGSILHIFFYSIRNKVKMLFKAVAFCFGTEKTLLTFEWIIERLPIKSWHGIELIGDGITYVSVENIEKKVVPWMMHLLMVNPEKEISFMWWNLFVDSWMKSKKM